MTIDDTYVVECKNEDCSWSGLSSDCKPVMPNVDCAKCPECDAPVEPVEY